MCVETTLDLRYTGALRNIASVPRIYDRVSEKYEWKNFDSKSFAIVPKITLNEGIHVGMSVCAWERIPLSQVSVPNDEPPFEGGSPKTKHSGIGETM
jgi:hypothetical protein